VLPPPSLPPAPPVYRSLRPATKSQRWTQRRRGWTWLGGWTSAKKEGSLGWAAVCSELLGQEADDGPEVQKDVPLQRSQSDQCSTTMSTTFQ